MTTTNTEKRIEIAHSWKAGETQNINKEDYVNAFTEHFSGFRGLHFGFDDASEVYLNEYIKFRELTASRAEQVFDDIYKKQS
jgi:hypothetical protein